MRDLLYKSYQGGFTVRIYAEPEHMSYIDAIGDDNESQAIQDKINNGEYQCFIAVCEASKKGIVLGTSNIGMNVYENPKDFVKNMKEDYAQQLVDDAVAEASEMLHELTKEE